MPGRIASTTLLLLVIGIAALPWGMPHTLRFVLPLLPAALVHAMSIDRPGALTALVAFGSGLIMDVITHGPLGYWALLFVIAHAGGCTLGLHLERRWRGGAWLGFALTALGLAAAGWGGASLIDLRAADPVPLVVAAIVIVPFYPPLAALSRAAGSGPIERLVVAGGEAKVRDAGGRLARGSGT